MANQSQSILPEPEHRSDRTQVVLRACISTQWPTTGGLRTCSTLGPAFIAELSQPVSVREGLSPSYGLLAALVLTRMHGVVGALLPHRSYRWRSRWFWVPWTYSLMTNERVADDRYEHLKAALIVGAAFSRL